MAQIWITNSEPLPGHTDAFQPANLPPGTDWIGNVYEKQGNVRKFLIKTFDSTDLTGTPGVVGPITQAQLQAGLDADNASNLRGFIVDDVPDWALEGES